MATKKESKQDQSIDQDYEYKNQMWLLSIENQLSRSVRGAVFDSQYVMARECHKASLISKEQFEKLEMRDNKIDNEMKEIKSDISRYSLSRQTT